MARKAFVKRYAQAIFEIALAQKDLNKWQAELEKVARLSDDVAFVTVLESPKFRLEDKVKVLAERLGAVSELALNLASLLIIKGRFGMARDITSEYKRLVDGYYGIEEAEVITAVPLSDAEREDLKNRLSALTGKKVVIRTEIDPKLIGGILVRIAGKLIDGSTRSKLADLKRELAGVRG